MASGNAHHLAAGRAQVIEQYGPWTDHNIDLGHGVYTIGESTASEKLRRIVQVVGDLSDGPISDLRVLDLACLEGQYAIEFARQGARAVAIEGRECNIAKAQFAKDALNLLNLDLIQDDVRNLTVEKYGTFDVVLCLGILYHLDEPAVFEIIERISSVCKGCAVFDTFVSVINERSYTYKGKMYWGRDMQEHDPSSDPEERLSDPWASLDNLKSVWITRATLVNLLVRTGFTSVYECWAPVEVTKPTDRITMVGIKGKRQLVISTPKLNEVIPELPEPFTPRVSPRQQPGAEWKKRTSLIVPRPLRRAAKRMLQSVGLMNRHLDEWEARLVKPRQKLVGQDFRR